MGRWEGGFLPHGSYECGMEREGNGIAADCREDGRRGEEAGGAIPMGKPVRVVVKTSRHRKKEIERQEN